MAHLDELLQWAQDLGVSILAAEEGYYMRRGARANQVAGFVVAAAAWQRRCIPERTCEGLTAERAKGIRLGIGRRTEPGDPAAVRAVKLRCSGLTIAEVARTPNQEGLRAARGCLWVSGNTYTLLKCVAPEVLPEDGLPEAEETVAA